MDVPALRAEGERRGCLPVAPLTPATSDEQKAAAKDDK